MAEEHDESARQAFEAAQLYDDDPGRSAVAVGLRLFTLDHPEGY